MFESLLIVWLTLSSGVAYFWPRLVAGFDPFVESRPMLGALISLTMFIVGGLMRAEEIREVFRRWPTVLYGTAVQYTAMPLLAWAFATLLPLSDDLRIGVIMVGCVPGAMASNVLTLLARGNVSYSVSLTTCSTMLSPVVVPLALHLTLAGSAQLDVLKVFTELLLQVVLPVFAGQLARRMVPAFDRFMERFGSILANSVVLWIIAVVVALNRERLAQATGEVLLALACVNLLGYLAGYLAGAAARFDEGMRRALTIEIGMQNAGLGTVLALNLFPGREAAAIPTALFTFGCMFTATILARVWAMHPPKGAPVVVAG